MGFAALQRAGRAAGGTGTPRGGSALGVEQGDALVGEVEDHGQAFEQPAADHAVDGGEGAAAAEEVVADGGGDVVEGALAEGEAGDAGGADGDGAGEGDLLVRRAGRVEGEPGLAGEAAVQDQPARGAGVDQEEGAERRRRSGVGDRSGSGAFGRLRPLGRLGRLGGLGRTITRAGARPGRLRAG